MGALISWNVTDGGIPGGSLSFDVVTAETVTKSSTATEKPVETGANISDHVRPNLDTLSLKVFVSNQPLEGTSRIDGSTRGAVMPNALDVPTPPPHTSITSLLAGALATLSSAPPLVKDPPVANLLTFLVPFSATIETFDLLDLLRLNAVPLRVISRDWFLENMIVQSLSEPRTADTGDGAEFEIEFKQIRIVETRLTVAPVPAEVRGKGTINAGAKGGTDPTPAKKASLLKTGADWLGGGGAKSLGGLILGGGL